MDIIGELQDLNLTENEARIYTALLELGRGTPLILANKTGIKRPTVYLVLEALRRKRLAGLTFHKHKQVYSAESPGQFFLHLREQERIAQQVVPILRGLTRHSVTKPTVRVYEDPREINTLFRSIWEYPDRCYISQYHEFAQLYDTLLGEYFRDRERKNFPGDRAIVSSHPKNIELAKEYHTKKYQIRVLPKGLAFDSDFSIWGNNVGVYSLDGHYVFVITNAQIANAFRSLFELAWHASTPPTRLVTTTVKKPRG